MRRIDKLPPEPKWAVQLGTAPLRRTRRSKRKDCAPFHTFLIQSAGRIGSRRINKGEAMEPKHALCAPSNLERPKTQGKARSVPRDDRGFALAKNGGLALPDRRGRRRRRLRGHIRCQCRPAKRDQSVPRRNELKAAPDDQSHKAQASNRNNTCHR